MRRNSKRCFLSITNYSWHASHVIIFSKVDSIIAKLCTDFIVGWLHYISLSLSLSLSYTNLIQDLTRNKHALFTSLPLLNSNLKKKDPFIMDNTKRKSITSKFSGIDSKIALTRSKHNIKQRKLLSSNNMCITIKL